MSTEEEFQLWLRRTEKTFVENFQFALKAWQSTEFTLTTKYEIVLSWLAEQMRSIKSLEDLPTQECQELMHLRAQPGLITQQTKGAFVEVLMETFEICCNERSADQTRIVPELLQSLSEYELLQDLFHSDYEKQAKLYGTLLRCYEKYLEQFDVADGSNSTLRAAHETEFFLTIMNALKDKAKKAGDTEKFEQIYTKHTLTPLAQVVLTLRKYALNFTDELVSLEQTLTVDCYDDALLERIVEQPLHVHLLILECAVVNRRTIETFLTCVLHKELTLQGKPALDISTNLTIAAYTLEILRKHEVNLNFIIADKPAFATVGARVYKFVQKHKETHLKEVLMLLGSVLRLNPLILEQHIFQITTWLLVAVKSGEPEEQFLYEEYLVLLMDMFRRLSRAEKFVINLLKALKEWLSNFQLQTAIKTSKRKKAAENNAILANTPKKKQRLSTCVVSTSGEEAFLDDAPCKKYLNILKQVFDKSSPSTKQHAISIGSFAQLECIWPSASVGMAFSKLVTGLVSKPSLVIWKSLLYSLKELLQDLQLKTQPLDENSHFNLELHAALLCQYFAGCKLTEQADKFAKEISTQRQLTAEVLQLFGSFLLGREHDQRAMSAFLECSYYVTSFELLLVYYRPDGLAEPSLEPAELIKSVHSFLTANEWSLIQQRVLNFGKSSCKQLLNRLYLQRKEADALLQHSAAVHAPKICLHKDILPASSNDVDQLKLLLQSGNSKWLITQMQEEEKAKIINTLLRNTDLLQIFTDDLSALELIALAIFEVLCKSFNQQCKNSLLAALNCDFNALRTNMHADVSSSNKSIQDLVDIISGHAANYTLKQLPNDEVLWALQVLQKLPIGHLRRQAKSLMFVLYLALYCDLKAAQADELADMSFEILKDLLHFGQEVPIFKYFSTAAILQLLPVTNCWELYEFLFAGIKNEEKGAEQFLKSLIVILKEAQAEAKLSDDYRRLTLIAIETLASISGPMAKRMRKYLDDILTIYAAYINAYFKHSQVKDVDKVHASKKDKKFVEKTLAGFATYLNATVAKTNAAEKTAETLVDDNFRRICKIYIGHSMDYCNPHAIRLIQVALNHRQHLHLDQDEIEFVLSNYWQQLNADIKANKHVNAKTMESVVKVIIGNKTNEDLLLTLKDIAAMNNDAKNTTNITRLLTLIAKCPFSTIKGAIFNEQFKQIICDITMHMCKNEQQQFVNYEHVLAVLAAQQAIIENKMIPISLDTLDNVLAFLMDINIKKFTLNDTNISCFKSLHLTITELCIALIKHRHILLMDRVPQFMHIFKDLLQTIVWYKSERQKDTALTATELDDLAELAMKLEALMHLIATHGIAVKRVAPFVLTFAINLMVASKRSTTLYPKIKTHIESICYDLIGICDHRVSRFILRCSNEAARQVYELLVKDHKKYHKFKGKV